MSVLLSPTALQFRPIEGNEEMRYHLSFHRQAKSPQMTKRNSFMYTVCCGVVRDTFSPYSDPQLSGVGLNFSRLLGSRDGSFCGQHATLSRRRSWYNVSKHLQPSFESGILFLGTWPKEITNYAHTKKVCSLKSITTICYSKKQKQTKASSQAKYQMKEEWMGRYILANSCSGTCQAILDHGYKHTEWCGEMLMIY